MRHRILAAATIALTALGLFSCDMSPTAPHLSQLTLDVVSGNGQSGVVGTEVATLIVIVRSNGNPVPLQVLNFRVLSGGGSVYGGTELTDNNGIAQEIWTLGTNASQPQRVEVRAVESSTGAQKVFATFTATVIADRAYSVSASAGDNQSAVAGSAVPISPAVRVADQYGNPISGVNVTFAVGPASGTATGLQQTTDPNGSASVGTWTLSGTAGPNTLLATTPGVILAGRPVRFTAIGTAGTASQLVVLSGNNQAASPGATLSNQPTVRVMDANGNGVPNVAVTFTVTGGGGSIDGVGSVTTLTASGGPGVLAGSAAVNWTLGSASGTNTLQATGVGLQGSPFTFTATGSCNCWTAKAPMPTGRADLGIGVVNGILYAVGGTTANRLATLEAYDPSTNTWTTKTSMPTARDGLAVGVVNGILYAVGGTTDGSVNLATVEAYDPATSTWTTKAPMPTGRRYVAGAVVNGILYVIGGLSNSTTASTVEAYDPVTNTWTTKASMPTPRDGAVADVINGVIYVAGGVGAAGSVVATVEAYDPATNTWMTRASMPSARYLFATGVLDRILYAAGGSPGEQATLEAYNPVTDTWTAKRSMPTARGGPAGGVFNGIFYVVGGFDASGNVSTWTTVQAYQP
jgi:N-acetylneuraminic acid mutarotase